MWEQWEMSLVEFHRWNVPPPPNMVKSGCSIFNIYSFNFILFLMALSTVVIHVYLNTYCKILFFLSEHPYFIFLRNRELTSFHNFLWFL